MSTYQTSSEVEDYRTGLPAGTKPQFDKLRAIVHEALPDGAEKISYKIPSIVYGGLHIIYFAGWAKFISMYPIPNGDPEFEAAIEPYKAGPGTLKFALDKPLPEALIKQVIQLHVDARIKK